ncbi:MAG: TIR domain-containing protein [Woeseiaceae bacterium]|nr:TIR domain-containing protein [Woeseiaceae bacterium]
MSKQTHRPFPDRFLVAFSFAGEQRDRVRTIAEATEQLLGFGTVFYDEWFMGQLVGTSADLKLQDIYGSQSDVVVICASADYNSKDWTIAEWDSIRARHMRLRAEGNGESDRLMPLRVADGDVEGLLDNAIWLDARLLTDGKLADLIVQRVRQFVAEAGRPRVFLAQTQSDMEDESQPVNRPKLKRFLEQDCQYSVSPTSDLLDMEPAEYRPALRAELDRCQVFVQLISRHPWKPGRYNEVQFTEASDAKLPQFCFRGDLPAESVTDEKQKAFIEGSGAIAGQFEDFKQHLQKKLGELADAQRTALRQFQEADRRSRLGTEAAESEDEQPLVRVAIRAGNGNDIWDQVWTFLEGKVLLDELGPDKTFESAQLAEPCHGFLILCDEKAQTDEAFSPREALAQCRQIQTQLKDASRVMPVGVVFCAPPAPAWSRLLKSTPRCLFRVLNNDLENGLSEFLKQVRDVRSAVS